jgi:hypothetical protein
METWLDMSCLSSRSSMLFFNRSIKVEEIIYSYLCEKLPFPNDLNPDDKFFRLCSFLGLKFFISKLLYSVHHYWSFNICWIYEFLKITVPLANEILFFFLVYLFLIQVVCGATISMLYRLCNRLCCPLNDIELLMQTPNSPIAASGGRKASERIILVCHGATKSSTEVRRIGQKVFTNFLKSTKLVLIKKN